MVDPSFRCNCELTPQPAKSTAMHSARVLRMEESGGGVGSFMGCELGGCQALAGIDGLASSKVACQQRCNLQARAPTDTGPIL